MRRLLLLVSALVVLATLGAGMAMAGSDGKTVRTLGDEVLQPNVGPGGPAVLAGARVAGGR